jgi:hypothetical protein
MSSADNNRAFEQRNVQNEQRPVLPVTQARQGVTGHNVRYVLGFGLLAVIVAFAVVWFVYFA